LILGHCHVGPPGYFVRFGGLKDQQAGTIEHLKTYLGEIGFEKAVVFAPSMTGFNGDPNAWLVEAVSGDSRFIPWLMVQSPGRESVEMMKAGLGGGVKGIKFHPPVSRMAINDPMLEQFYRSAELSRLPILYHTGPHGWNLEKYRPILIDRVAQRHPRLPLIIEHLGGAGFARETYAVMQNNANCFGGLATCLTEESTWHVPLDEIKRMIMKFGAERFIFGADFPYNSVEENRKALEVLKGMGLSLSDVSLIVSGNLERLMSRVGEFKLG